MAAALARDCPGCGKLFMSNGHWSHLSQSRNPSCKAILSEQLTAVVSDSEISPSESLQVVQDTEDLLPVLFSGNLFGSAANYSHDDFGQIDGNQINADAEDDENKEDEDQHRMNYELEMSWEHDRTNRGPSDFEDKGDDDDHTSTFDDSSCLSALANLQLALFAIYPNILIHMLAQWYWGAKLQMTDIRMLSDWI